MRYCLVILKNNHIYEIHNYSQFWHSNNLNEKNLKDIVNFTHEFVSEEELLNYLIYLNLIPKSYQNGTLGICYYKNKTAQPKLLPYGLSYSLDKEFYNPQTLLYYYIFHLTNEEFMTEFLEKYYLYLKNVPIFQNSLDFLYYNYQNFKSNYLLRNEGAIEMEYFIANYSRKKSNPLEQDFTRLRDLAMFAINFQRNFKQNKEITRKEDSSLLQLELQHYETLLNNPDRSWEEYQIYQKKIAELQTLIAEEEKENLKISRRLKK